MITIIKKYSATKVVLKCLTTGKEITIQTSVNKPFDYDIIKKIWEDIEIK